VMGSHQVQAYQADMQNKSMQTGNEGFGVLAWDANQNKYVMLDPTNQQASSGNVTGNMPTLGNNQFGYFGMHTHPESATPSEQDLRMTQQLGLDQFVIGTNGTSAIMTNKPSNAWQGKRFEFESAYHDSVSGAGYGSTSGSDDSTGVGGAAVGGQSVNSSTGSYGTYYNPETGTNTILTGPIQVGGNSGNWAVGMPGQRYGNFAILGGTREQSVALGNSIREVGATNTGNSLYSLLTGGPITITVGSPGAYRQLGGAGALIGLDNGLYSIYIASNIVDNNGMCCYDTATGRAPYTLTRVVAHEMGHPAGMPDNGSGFMNNVNTWENPIMNEADPNSPNRTKYP
jgi:hypothetical protein